MLYGHCDEKFEEAREIFGKSISSGFELGAAIAIEIEGEMVLDLWGGIDNVSTESKWKEDTIVNVFSTTKGVAAICLLQLVEQGLVDLDAPVVKYWPEFGKNGKREIPVRYLFCHKSGLSGVRKPLPNDAWYKWDLICESLAEQEPWWEPGTAHGYHAMTYGYLIGEMVRRVSGMSIGEYFRKNIGDPLDLDFWIGLPENEFSRVTDLHPSLATPLQKLLMPLFKITPRGILPPIIRMLLDFSDPKTISGAAFSNPVLSMEEPFYVNTDEWRKAEIPAANGHGSARSLAYLYGVLANGGNRNGTHVLAPETIEKARKTESDGKDLVLGGIHSKFGLGFMLGTEHINMGPGAGSFGHGGAGGSLGFADPDNKISLGFVMNQMHPGITAWKTAIDVADSVYSNI